MKLHTALLVVAAHLLLHAPAHAQEPPHSHGDHEHRLGSVAFPNSGAAAAQEPFLRGIALLHSFEYEDAADAFREAQALDPAFAAAAYERALRRWPNRPGSLLGLARARSGLGDRAAAAEAYGKLLANWHRADPDLPVLEEVRRGATAGLPPVESR